MSEIWKPIAGFRPWYEVSDHGNVRTVPRTFIKSNGVVQNVLGQVMKKQTINKGCNSVYWTVTLRNPSGKCKRVRVCRLVLMAFVGPCPPGMECCHGPGGSTDDRVSNLRWDTHRENALDVNRFGTRNSARGKRHGKAKLTPEAVRAIRQSKLSISELARQYGVHGNSIRGVRDGRVWAHVK